MTNFDFLLEEKIFRDFASAAVSAEKIAVISYNQAILSARRAAEFAVKWLYDYNPRKLQRSNADTFDSLIKNDAFVHLVHKDNVVRLNFIKRAGNQFAHDPSKEADLVLTTLVFENLFEVLSYFCIISIPGFKKRSFNKELVGSIKAAADPVTDHVPEPIEDKECHDLSRQQLEDNINNLSTSMEPTPLDLSEAQTRKYFIDAALEDVGWKVGSANLLTEIKIEDMPNKAGEGYADYVMYGDDGRPLAVIEAKRFGSDPAKGRQQAELYARYFEKKFGRKPVIFLTNGYEIYINDGFYPERRVYDYYSKQDLEKWFNLQEIRRISDQTIKIDEKIVERSYQKQAIKNTCDRFIQDRQRRALIVMATGSGKTRTAIALCDVLFKKGWISRMLFLADRTVLVRQAKNSFAEHLKNANTLNLCDYDSDNDIVAANCIFSTYQTLMNKIDTFIKVGGKEVPFFTSGYFDLIICDEAHRSIYNKYRSIFNHFDGLLIGLTATPKEDIDKNTYGAFDLEKGMPTFEYSLQEAVADGYLVNFKTVRSKLKFMEYGIKYSELSDEEKTEYEDTFADVGSGEMPFEIDSAKINAIVFNEDTIKKVLDLLMSRGLKVDYGERIGKTIIFAKNHKHAEKIYEIFNKEYPTLAGQAQVIDNQIKYSQSLIDSYSMDGKDPQIAISVDMLDTGVDVPSILNLVFFKKVLSKSKFWQMIGRGTRLCPGLIDGADKTQFYIFDICSNFDFFEVNPRGVEAPLVRSLQSSLFRIKLQLVCELQKDVYQTPELKEFRQWLVSELVRKAKDLENSNFQVKQHIKWVEFCRHEENFNNLSDDEAKALLDEVMPIVLPDKEDVRSLRFDALMLGIELAQTVGKRSRKAFNDLDEKLGALTKLTTIKAVKEKIAYIEQVRSRSFLEKATLLDFEKVRTELRELMAYIENKPSATYTTHFDDDVLSEEWGDANLALAGSVDYRVKVKEYVLSHSDHPIIRKIKENIPLIEDDVKGLQEIFWKELGGRDDYEKSVGNIDLGLFIRSIVGLDLHAAKEAFSQFLDVNVFNEAQINFVNLIVEYIAKNGFIKDMSILMEDPFTLKGGVSELYDMESFKKIKDTINQVKRNADTASVLA